MASPIKNPQFLGPANVHGNGNNNIVKLKVKEDGNKSRNALTYFVRYVFPTLCIFELFSQEKLDKHTEYIEGFVGNICRELGVLELFLKSEVILRRGSYYDRTKLLLPDGYDFFSILPNLLGSDSFTLFRFDFLEKLKASVEKVLKNLDNIIFIGEKNHNQKTDKQYKLGQVSVHFSSCGPSLWLKVGAPLCTTNIYLYFCSETKPPSMNSETLAVFFEPFTETVEGNNNLCKEVWVDPTANYKYILDRPHQKLLVALKYIIYIMKENLVAKCNALSSYFLKTVVIKHQQVCDSENIGECFRNIVKYLSEQITPQLNIQESDIFIPSKVLNGHVHGVIGLLWIQEHWDLIYDTSWLNNFLRLNKNATHSTKQKNPFEHLSDVFEKVSSWRPKDWSRFKSEWQELLDSIVTDIASARKTCAFVGCNQQVSEANLKEHEAEYAVQHASMVHQLVKDTCRIGTSLNDETTTDLTNIANQLLLTLPRIEQRLGLDNVVDLTDIQHKLVTIKDGLDITSDKENMFSNVLKVFQDESKWVKDRLANLESGIQKHFFQVLKNLFVQHQRTDKFIRQQEESIKKLDEEMDDHKLTVHNGVMIFPIDNFQARFEAAKMRNPASVTSPAFYSRRGGYKVKVRVYLNGDGLGLGTHVSIYVMICKSKFDALLPWPFNQKLTLGIMNQMDPKKDYMDAFRPNKALNTWGKPVAETNTPTGIPKFLGLETVLDPSQGYVVDDVMYVKVVLEQEPKTPLSAFLGYKEIEEQ